MWYIVLNEVNYSLKTAFIQSFKMKSTLQVYFQQKLEKGLSGKRNPTLKPQE